jgi:hypothetical protein
MLFSHKGLVVKYVHRYWKKVKKVPFLPNTNKEFNYIQEETLYGNCMVLGGNLLVVLLTGFGKSLIFQLLVKINEIITISINLLEGYHVSCVLIGYATRLVHY